MIKLVRVAFDLIVDNFQKIQVNLRPLTLITFNLRVDRKFAITLQIAQIARRNTSQFTETSAGDQSFTNQCQRGNMAYHVWRYIGDTKHAMSSPGPVASLEAL